MPRFEVLPASPGEGYIYLIEFRLANAKIGRTINPRGRLRAHVELARFHGNGPKRVWISAPHANYKETEELLVGRALGEGRPVIGREYFAGIDFDKFVSLGEKFAAVLGGKPGVTSAAEPEDPLTAMFGADPLFVAAAGPNVIRL